MTAPVSSRDEGDSLRKVAKATGVPAPVALVMFGPRAGRRRIVRRLSMVSDAKFPENALVNATGVAAH